MNKKIILYSNNCPRCRVLETKLSNANIEFEISGDMNKVMDEGFYTVPVLQVAEDRYLDFVKAIDWINEVVRRNAV